MFERMKYNFWIIKRYNFIISSKRYKESLKRLGRERKNERESIGGQANIIYIFKILSKS